MLRNNRSIPVSNLTLCYYYYYYSLLRGGDQSAIIICTHVSTAVTDASCYVCIILGLLLTQYSVL